MYLICHMTSHGYLIERSCEFMGGSSLCYDSMLISVVTIVSIVMVQLCF